MQTDPPCFTVNVSGRRFELNLATVQRIPYLYTLIQDCATGESEIYVARSPMLFEHVLALAYDSEYRCPAECHGELDFYLMERSGEDLCEMERLLRGLGMQFSANKILDSRERETLRNAIINTQCGQEFNFPCKVKDCSDMARRQSKCEAHKGVCLECREKTRHNYCKLHQETGTYCIRNLCMGLRAERSMLCPLHLYYK
jgi:hypothetical protein